MDHNQTPPPPGWQATLDKSEADHAAGHIVSGDTLMQDRRESIAHPEAKQSRGNNRVVSPNH